LIPSTTQGFGFRGILFETDARRIAHLSAGLLESMREARSVRFLTVGEYVATLNREGSAQRSL
jgi:hypothetical protein